MGKKVNTNAKEKKAERKAMEARMNPGVAAVRAANSVADPLACWSHFQTFWGFGIP